MNTKFAILLFVLVLLFPNCRPEQTNGDAAVESGFPCEHLRTSVLQTPVSQSDTMFILLNQFEQCCIAHNTLKTRLALLVVKSNVYLRMRMLDSAEVSIIDYNNLVTQSTDSLRDYEIANGGILYGLLLEHREKYAEAIRAYHKTLEGLQGKQKVDGAKVQVLHNLALVYWKVGLEKETISAIGQALEIGQRRQWWDFVASDAQFMGEVYSELGMTDSANVYLDLAQKFPDVSNGNVVAFLTSLRKLYNDPKTNLEAVKGLLRQHQTTLNELSPDLVISSCKLIAGTFLKNNDATSAKPYLDKAHEQSIVLDASFHQKEIAKMYAQYYTLTGDVSKENDWLNTYVQLKDSLAKVEKELEVSTLYTLYELGKKDFEIQELEQQQQQDRLWKKILLILLILVVIVLGFVWIYSRQQLRISRLLSDSRKLELKQQATALVSEKLEKQLLHEQLDHKSRELMTLTAQIVHKNELTESISKRIDSIIRTESTIMSHKGLREIQSSIRSEEVFEKDWETFRTHFEKVHPSFFRKIQESFPDLTQNDLRHCAFMRLNLSRKEIALLLSVSLDAVKVARQRLKKRMNMEQDEDLFGYINQI